MASIEEIRNTRLAKLEALKSAGINAYPTKTDRDCDLIEAVVKFDKLSKKKSVSLAGRVMSLRPQGGLIFFTLDDGTGRFQGLIKSDEVALEIFDLFSKTTDIGDFIQVSGTLFVTKRNEKTLQVKTWNMLAKSLRPLPEKWHGLQDVEERFRHRYLDTLMSPEVKQRFILRSKMVSEIRKFYDDAGYIEVETPRLQILAGGATAEPFVTHHNALDIDFHLTIAQELYLKELLIGGFTKVYEIGRKFRNEGIDATHNPEFTMLESNESYADALSQRNFIEKLFKHLVKKLFGSDWILHNEQKIDFGADFSVITFFDLLKRHALVSNPESIGREELALKATQLGVTVEPSESLEKIMDNIYKKTCRSKLVQPTFIIDYPVSFNPFAKRKEENPALIDRFQLIAGGIELVNAFSELNNPVDQKERYLEQDKKKAKGEHDISPSDQEYLEAMEYGMPPNGGIGIGIDRLTMLFSDSKNIKEVILFPTLRPKIESTGKKERKIAVAVVNKSLGLKRWEELNTVAHLSASLGARKGKGLLFREEIETKDARPVALNIQHAIMIKEGRSTSDLTALAREAREKNLTVTEFTREMLATTDDKKVIAETKTKNAEEIEYLGVLVFGDKTAVEQLTEKFSLFG
ncbi:MAG: lysine--tRNA ligase [bacterium]|nr:lysine--tRNA ligase [bacterium]